MVDLVVYLTEDQHDRLYNYIRKDESLRDIIDAICDAEYCECFECKNGA